MKKLTLEELALLAGVSKTTASLILNGRAEQYRISPATRERVLALAETHHFTPDANAASLRSGRDRSIGVVIPGYSHGPSAQLLAALEPLVRANGDQLLVSCSQGDAALELAALRQLLARKVSGLLLLSVQQSATPLEFLPLAEVPLVVVGRHWPDSALRQFADGSAAAMTLLLGSLLERLKPSQLLLLNGPQEQQEAQIRAAVLQRALQGRVIQPLVSHGPDEAGSAAARLDLACEQLGAIPGLLIASSSAQLEGALAFLTYHRNRWPAGLTLACCEHQPLYPHLALPCYSLSPDWPACAQAALALLAAAPGVTAPAWRYRLHLPQQTHS